MLTKSAHKFAAVLAEWMKIHAPTGPKAALALNVRHQVVYAWLAGSNLPPRLTAERIADRMRMPDLPAQIARERKARRRAAERRTPARRTGAAS